MSRSMGRSGSVARDHATEYGQSPPAESRSSTGLSPSLSGRAGRALRVEQPFRVDVDFLRRVIEFAGDVNGELPRRAVLAVRGRTARPIEVDRLAALAAGDVPGGRVGTLDGGAGGGERVEAGFARVGWRPVHLRRVGGCSERSSVPSLPSPSAFASPSPVPSSPSPAAARSASWSASRSFPSSWTASTSRATSGPKRNG